MKKKSCRAVMKSGAESFFNINVTIVACMFSLALSLAIIVVIGISQGDQYIWEDHYVYDSAVCLVQSEEGDDTAIFQTIGGTQLVLVETSKRRRVQHHYMIRDSAENIGYQNYDLNGVHYFEFYKICDGTIIVPNPDSPIDSEGERIISNTVPLDTKAQSRFIKMKTNSGTQWVMPMGTFPIYDQNASADVDLFFKCRLRGVCRFIRYLIGEDGRVFIAGAALAVFVIELLKLSIIVIKRLLSY